MINSQTLPDSYRQYKLENGLKVISVINRNFPLATVCIHLDTGYSWEPDELQGISHVVEHNLMHSSEKRKDIKTFSIDRRRAGALYDAGTSYDFTEYLLMVPVKNLSSAIDIMCDGFGKPVFHPDIFKSELGAIKQESRRKTDMPRSMVQEKLYETAYKVNRIKRWRLGTEESLNRLTPEDLDNYFAQRYGPHNYVLVIAGDIDHDKVEKEIRETFGKLPAGNVWGEPSETEPPQNEIRYSELRRQVNQVYWICGFHTPKYLARENAALELLAIILGQGFNSRLNINIREKKGLVDEISVKASDFDENTMFNVFMKTDVQRLEEAEKAVVREILKTARYKVNYSELERARNILEKDILFSHDDLREYVNKLSIMEIRTGSFLNCNKYLDEIFSVTPDEILEIAAKYLTPQNLSICTIIPDKEDFKIRDEKDIERTIESINLEDESNETDEKIAVRKSFSLLIPAGKPLNKVKKFNLSNNGRVLLLENERLPIFTSVLLFRGGKSMEHIDNCGITSLMQTSMLKGTENYTSQELLGRLEAIGSTITPVINNDSFGFAISGVKSNFFEAMNILMEILLCPSFPSAEIEIEKRKIIAKVRGIEDLPRDHSMSLFFQEVFKGHPYGLPMGLENSVKSIKRDHLLDWYENILSGSNLVFALGGDIREDELLLSLKPLEAIEMGRKFEIPVFSPLMSEKRESIVTKKRKQTSTIIGYPSAPAGHKDFPVFEVIRGITTGDGGRFWDEIRGRRGLAYVVHTYHQTCGKGGAFLAYAATSPDTAELTEELLLNEYKRIYKDPPSAEEFKRAKSYISGLHLTGERTTSLRTIALASSEISDIGTDSVFNYQEKIDEVTREEVIDVAEKYFKEGFHCKAQVMGE